MTDLSTTDADSSPKADKISLFDRLFNDTATTQAPPTTSGFMDTSFGLGMSQLGKHPFLGAEGKRFGGENEEKTFFVENIFSTFSRI